jgi:rfaE bifunctional protein kinase chain/domain
VISRDRVMGIVGGMPKRRIVVVGDAMLDVYLIGDVERISPEAPVPVVAVQERRHAVGGAANVAANVAAIGAHVSLVATIGDDGRGEHLRAEMAAAGISDGSTVTLAGRPTTSKTRVVARGQQMVRIDEEEDAALEGGAQEAVIAAARSALADADAVLIEDYNKGVLTPAVIQVVLDTARARGIPSVVDPKFRNFFAYRGSTIFKPNRRELEHADALPQAMERLDVQNLLLTLGAQGMVLVSRDGTLARIPTVAREVYDVSGAGDTVTAWAGTALASGASVQEAAELANYAAGIEVGKSGVAVVTCEEVLDLYERNFDQVGMFRRGGVL